MKYLNIKSLLAVAALLVSAQAQALLITPSDCGTTFVCETGTETSTSIINAYIESTYGVNELYKSNVGGGDEGAFAGDYTTTFTNSASDPSDASIAFTGTDSISCPDCYLLVKDGNHSPAWYLFDISSWDGTETIDLRGFWPDGGAISHVSIYGDGDRNVPEPGVLALLAVGLLGLGLRSRRKIS